MVEQTGFLEPATKAMSDDQLRAKTLEFRARIAARLEGIDDPEERSHLYALDTASISDEIAVALDERSRRSGR